MATGFAHIHSDIQPVLSAIENLSGQMADMKHSLLSAWDFAHLEGRVDVIEKKLGIGSNKSWTLGIALPYPQPPILRQPLLTTLSYPLLVDAIDTICYQGTMEHGNTTFEILAEMIDEGFKTMASTEDVQALDTKVQAFDKRATEGCERIDNLLLAKQEQHLTDLEAQMCNAPRLSCRHERSAVADIVTRSNCLGTL
jgi:hypothetical protein